MATVPKKTRAVASTASSSPPAQPIRKKSPDPAPPATTAREGAPGPTATPPAAERTPEDLSRLWELIHDGMRNNVPANHPARFKIEQMVHEVHAGNGDVEDWPPDAEMAEAIDAFMALPEDERRRMLGGWSPKVIEEVDRKVHRKLVDTKWPLIPVLQIDVGPYDNDMDHPSTQFNGFIWDDPKDVWLLVRATATKAEVLRALEYLTYVVDHHWANMIADCRGGERSGS
jgi:hypothetical protein